MLHTFPKILSAENSVSECNETTDGEACCHSNFRTSIGGQALIEGILMRGPEKQAIVCRTQDGLIEKIDNLKFSKTSHSFWNIPFLRGIVIFIDSMVNGVRALSYSANLLPEDEQESENKFDLWIENHFTEEKSQKVITYTAVILGVLLAVLLFTFLPTLLAGLFSGIREQYFLRNLVEGGFRIVIFLLYIIIISKMKDMKRVFSYHGAEHKTIFCYEHGKQLTVENIRLESRFHPRCGTSFLFVVIIISILVNSIVTLSNTFARFGIHLLLIPVVVGISYEINRWCGGHDNLLSKILSAPGKWMQHFTTNEPDDSMIECAIRALQLVLPSTKGADAW